MHGMVFTKIFRRLILGLWGATLCSCTTYRTLSIEILQPAGFHIEQGKKLALLERCYNMFKRTGNGLLEPILYSAPFRSG